MGETTATDDADPGVHVQTAAADRSSSKIHPAPVKFARVDVLSRVRVPSCALSISQNGHRAAHLRQPSLFPPPVLLNREGSSPELGVRLHLSSFNAYGVPKRPALVVSV